MFTVVLTDVLQVGLDPVSAVVISTTVGPTRVIDDGEVGDITSTVDCKVLDSTDTVVETVSAPYAAAESGYVAPLSPFATEGDFFLIWIDDGVPIRVDHVLAVVPKEFELVTLEAFFTDSSSQAIPHVGTTVLFSRKSDGFPVAQDVTDSNGFVSVVLPPDIYLVTLDKTGTTYSRNNVKLEVVDISSVETGSNDFRLESESFAPTLTPPAAAVATATIFANLYEFDGTPMRNTEVLVALAQGPENLSGNAVFGTAKVFKTDQNGYVEFEMVQGIVVTVAIMSHSLRKTITIPSGVPAMTPTNLLDLMSTAPDTFDIVVVDIPAAPRRSI